MLKAGKMGNFSQLDEEKNKKFFFLFTSTLMELDDGNQSFEFIIRITQQNLNFMEHVTANFVGERMENAINYVPI